MVTDPSGMRQLQGVTIALVLTAVLQCLLLSSARAQGPTILATQPQAAAASQHQLANAAAWQGDSTKQTSSNALQQGSVPGVVPQYGQNLDASHGGGLQIQPVTPPVAPSTAGQAGAPTCNIWTHNATMNGCVVPQANGACPLQCTSGSPAGCSERFQCWNGCPACLPSPQAPQCSGFKQIEIGQLDDTIGVSEVPFGNLSYWFQGSSIVLSIQLNQGMFFQPIGVYVNKTSPPIGPPSQQDSQTVVKYDDSDPNWDMLAAPFTSCVSYVKDLSPLNFGDQVYISVASFTCAQAEDGRCACKGLMDNVGGSLCIYQPEPGKKIPTSSPSRFLRAPFSGCEYVTARYCPPGFSGGDIGAACVASTGQCSANNTCGSGPFPVAPHLACNGFNPEGADLGTTARCATNAYDNNGYLTLDFTCDTATCVTDGDCPLGYMCAAATPCLDGSGQCTAKCVPLAASFCTGICPNALQYVPSNNPAVQQQQGGAAQQPLGGNALLQALGAQPGPSQGRIGASKWLRSDPAPSEPVNAEISNVVNLG